MGLMAKAAKKAVKSRVKAKKARPAGKAEKKAKPLFPGFFKQAFAVAHDNAHGIAQVVRGHAEELVFELV